MVDLAYVSSNHANLAEISATDSQLREIIGFRLELSISVANNADWAQDSETNLHLSQMCKIRLNYIDIASCLPTCSIHFVLNAFGRMLVFQCNCLPFVVTCV